MRVAKPKLLTFVYTLRLYIAKIVRVAKRLCIYKRIIRCLYIAKIVRVAKRWPKFEYGCKCLYIAKIVRVAKLWW